MAQYSRRRKILNQFFLNFLLMFQLVSIESHRIFKMTGINCESLSKSYLKFAKCYIKAVRRDVNELTVHVTLLRKPLDNITISSHLCRRGLEHQKPLIEYTIDGCAFFRNKRRNPFANIFYNLFGMADYSNMNHTCPYNHDIILEKFRFDDKRFDLLPAPTGHYSYVTIWSMYNVKRATVTLYFQIFEK